MGVLAGLHGALYNRCLIFIRSFRDKLLLKRPVYRLLHLAVVIMITTCVVVYLPRDPNYLGACTPYSDTVQHVGELSCVVDCQLEGNVYVPLSLNGGCKDVCLTSNAQTNFDNVSFFCLAFLFSFLNILKLTHLLDRKYSSTHLPPVSVRNSPPTHPSLLYHHNHLSIPPL